MATPATQRSVAPPKATQYMPGGVMLGGNQLSDFWNRVLPGQQNPLRSLYPSLATQLLEQQPSRLGGGRASDLRAPVFDTTARMPNQTMPRYPGTTTPTPQGFPGGVQVGPSGRPYMAGATPGGQAQAMPQYPGSPPPQGFPGGVQVGPSGRPYMAGATPGGQSQTMPQYPGTTTTTPQGFPGGVQVGPSGRPYMAGATPGGQSQTMPQYPGSPPPQGFPGGVQVGPSGRPYMAGATPGTTGTTAYSGEMSNSQPTPAPQNMPATVGGTPGTPTPWYGQSLTNPSPNFAMPIAPPASAAASGGAAAAWLANQPFGNSLPTIPNAPPGGLTLPSGPNPPPPPPAQPTPPPGWRPGDSFNFSTDELIRSGQPGAGTPTGSGSGIHGVSIPPSSPSGPPSWQGGGGGGGGGGSNPTAPLFGSTVVPAGVGSRPSGPGSGSGGLPHTGGMGPVLPVQPGGGGQGWPSGIAPPGGQGYGLSGGPQQVPGQPWQSMWNDSWGIHGTPQYAAPEQFHPELRDYAAGRTGRAPWIPDWMGRPSGLGETPNMGPRAPNVSPPDAPRLSRTEMQQMQRWGRIGVPPPRPAGFNWGGLGRGIVGGAAGLGAGVAMEAGLDQMARGVDSWRQGQGQPPFGSPRMPGDVNYPTYSGPRGYHGQPPPPPMTREELDRLIQEGFRLGQ